MCVCVCVCMQHDSSMCVPWLPHTHMHFTPLCITCVHTHTHMRDHTLSYMCHVCLIHIRTLRRYASCVYTHKNTFATWMLYMCAVSASHAYCLTHIRSLRRYASCVRTDLSRRKQHLRSKFSKDCLLLNLPPKIAIDLTFEYFYHYAARPLPYPPPPSRPSNN